MDLSSQCLCCSFSCGLLGVQDRPCFRTSAVSVRGVLNERGQQALFPTIVCPSLGIIGQVCLETYSL